MDTAVAPVVTLFEANAGAASARATTAAAVTALDASSCDPRRSMRQCTPVQRIVTIAARGPQPPRRKRFGYSLSRYSRGGDDGPVPHPVRVARSADDRVRRRRVEDLPR